MKKNLGAVRRDWDSALPKQVGLTTDNLGISNITGVATQMMRLFVWAYLKHTAPCLKDWIYKDEVPDY